MSKELTLTPVSIDRLEGIGHNEEPIAPRWKSLKWTKEAAKRVSPDRPQPAYYKITDGPGWWVLDDISRGAVGDDIAAGSGWCHTSQESLERLKLLFRVLGVDDRLVIRENPEWATPLDPKHAQAGVRAGRK
jgi:hypothetical protein